MKDIKEFINEAKSGKLFFVVARKGAFVLVSLLILANSADEAEQIAIKYHGAKQAKAIAVEQLKPSNDGILCCSDESRFIEYN